MNSSIDDSTRLRLRILGVVIVSLFGAMFARLWYLQVLEAEELQVAATANVIRVVPEQAPRGQILDRKGKVLVENTVVNVVMIDKQKLTEADLDDTDKDLMMLRLAVAISRTGRLAKMADIEAAINDSQYASFDSVPVIADVDPTLLVYLGERPDEFPGVHVVQRTVRSYPYGGLGAHVLGYVGSITEQELIDRQGAVEDGEDGDADEPANPKSYQPSDEIGKTGIERTFEHELRGTPGRRVYEVDHVGRVVRELVDERVEPIPGNDVWLTIDIDLQASLEEKLLDGLVSARANGGDADGNVFNAPAGAGVALDPRDGSVLAMASYPTYNPADFVNGITNRQFEELTDPDNFSPILNRAIQGAYAPGSTFKPVTALAAFADDLYGPGGVFGSVGSFYEDVGSYTLGRCDEESGTCVFNSPFDGGSRSVDLRTAMAVSSDTYFYKLGGEGFFPKPRGEDEGIQAESRLFGLGATTGIALPYETAGAVPDRDYFDRKFEEGAFIRSGDEWYAGDTINLSIGQGDLLVTPLQLANVYATIANGGDLHQPNIVGKITDRDGALVADFGPRVLRSIEMPDEVYSAITDGLIQVPRYNVYASEFNHGTAAAAFRDFPLSTWPVAGKTGTSQKTGKADFALFAGYGPTDAPEFEIVGQHEPEIAMAVVLEESGFGSESAAPIVADIFNEIANGTLSPALSQAEIDRHNEEALAVKAAEADAALQGDDG